MSQRNPLNDRYQNADDRKGTTRKSAASAKPATKAASSVRIEGKVEEPKGLFARASAQANKTQAMKNSRAKQNDKARVERRKEQAAEERRLAKEAEAAAEAGEEEEKRGLFRGLFTKKRASEAVATAKEAQVRAAEEAEAAEAK